jgi:hypothetical protein
MIVFAKEFFLLVLKNLVEYVQPTLATGDLAICTFDLLMSKGVHDVFIVVVIFFQVINS